MAINIRQIASDNSHLRYNTNVSAGESVIEFARFGSVLVNGPVGIAAVSVYIAANPDVKITSAATAETAINYGLRLLVQSAISVAIKRPNKSVGAAETALRQHLPGLFPNTTPANP